MSSVICIVTHKEEFFSTIRQKLEGMQNPAVFQWSQTLKSDQPWDLLILHVTTSVACRQQTLAGIKTILQAQPNVAILAVFDDLDEEWQLRFRKAGVGYILTRPVDYWRLRFLADSLTVRSRLEASQQCDQFLAEMFPNASAAMQRLVKRIGRLAPRRVNILLQGETGVGKTHIAKILHRAAGRPHAPLIHINCNSIPEALFESELFGHCRGAFTGADRNRKGRFEAAQGGTLLLDDIEATPLDCQAKLLRAVEERQYEPVGSNQTRIVDCRIITASNRDLQELVAARQFRGDLLYRLGVVRLLVPPLRERKSEIRTLIDSCLAELAAIHAMPRPTVEEDVIVCLLNYNWPGNVRELRNCLEHAMMFSEAGVIRRCDLPDEVAQASPSWRLSDARRQGEVELIRQTLERFQNNRTRTAAALGVSRAALYKRMGILGIQ